MHKIYSSANTNQEYAEIAYEREKFTTNTLGKLKTTCSNSIAALQKFEKELDEARSYYINILVLIWQS